MSDLDADARRAEVLAKARATLERLKETPEQIAERAERQRQAQVTARIDEAVAKARQARAESEADDKPAEKAERWVRPELNNNVTLRLAEDLCVKAWSGPYIRDGRGPRASIMGNCENKALWLQERLGGVVVGGWYPGDKSEYHATLIFACDGDLYAADWSKITPLSEYKFYFNGFYQK